MPTENTIQATTVEARWQRGFWSLIATQFQGAFNENGLKSLVIFLVIGMGFRQAERDRLVLIVTTLFSAPFILFSMAGGYFADRYSKRSVTIWTKVLEIGVMGLAIAGLAWQNLYVELTAVFLASTQAALFGPAKYGLLPELLPQKRLSWGNGIIELGTFIAVIAATVAAGVMADAFHAQQHWSGVILLSLSAAGLLCSLGITRVPAANRAKKFHANPLGELFTQIGMIRKDRVLWLAVLGNTYFWFLAALLQSNIIIYGNDILKIAPGRNGMLQAAIAIGIGLGSLAAGYASGDKIEYGLIPLGSIGMTALAIWLSMPGLTFASVLTLLACLGFAA